VLRRDEERENVDSPQGGMRQRLTRLEREGEAALGRLRVGQSQRRHLIPLEAEDVLLALVEVAVECHLHIALGSEAKGGRGRAIL